MTDDEAEEEPSNTTINDAASVSSKRSKTSELTKKSSRASTRKEWVSIFVLFIEAVLVNFLKKKNYFKLVSYGSHLSHLIFYIKCLTRYKG